VTAEKGEKTMKNSLKATYFAVLLAVSLTVASPAFAAGMKTKTADNSIVLPDLSFNEGYSGGYTNLTTPEPSAMDIAKLNTDLSFNEGFHGGYSQQATPEISVADASNLNTDLSFNEGFHGGYSAQIVREVASHAKRPANAVDSSKSLHGGGQ